MERDQALSNTPGPLRTLRIVAAITRKDVGEALRNKTILGILLGTVFIMLSSMALPFLLSLRDIPTALVYDPERSTLVRGLTTRTDFRLRLVDSQEELETTIGGNPELILGLVIPPGFRRAEGSGASIQIDGYVAHWANPDRVAELVTTFETELGKASWQTVHIDVEGHTVFPSLEEPGHPGMISMTLITIVLVIGLAVVPYLLIEEKESHTLDALLVSPARLGQILSAKVLVGMGYCVIGLAIVLLLNARWIVNWPVVLLAALLGTAFTVSLGLLIGTFCQEATAVNAWMAALVLLLLVPTFLDIFSLNTPPAVQAITRWVPTSALGHLFRLSTVQSPAGSSMWLDVLSLLGSTLAVGAVLVWRENRSNR